MLASATSCAMVLPKPWLPPPPPRRLAISAWICWIVSSIRESDRARHSSLPHIAWATSGSGRSPHHLGSAGALAGPSVQNRHHHPAGTIARLFARVTSTPKSSAGERAGAPGKDPSHETDFLRFPRPGTGEGSAVNPDVRQCGSDAEVVAQESAADPDGLGGWQRGTVLFVGGPRQVQGLEGVPRTHKVHLTPPEFGEDRVIRPQYA